MTASAAKTHKPNPRLDAALQCAFSGLAVFPLSGKTPAISKEKGGRGFIDATTDEKTILQWARDYPNANWGLRTGDVNHLLVVDVDSLEAHVQLTKLEEQHAPLPRTFQVETRPNRYQLWFKQPAGFKGKCSTSELATDIDVRSDGGYVVMPPSIHPDTRQPYQVVQDIPWADAPDWLLVLVAETDRKKPRKTSENPGDGKIPKGQRNSWLTSQAGAYRRRGDSDEVIFAKLKIDYAEHCEHTPTVNDDELRSISRSVAKYPTSEASHDGVSPSNDAANVRRFSHQHAPNLRYLADLKTWRCWNGKYWQPDDATGGPTCCALETATRIFDEAKQLTGEDQKQRAKWAVQSGDRKRLDAMVALARGVPAIRVRNYSDTFDHQPDLLTCNNGIVDLRTGLILPFRQDLMLTQIASVNFSPTAKCPSYDSFIADAFEHDREIIEYFDRVMGYCITGHTKERAFFLLLGDGRNGKTTIAELLKKILGAAAHRADFATFVRASYQDPGPTQHQISSFLPTSASSGQSRRREKESSIRRG